MFTETLCCDDRKCQKSVEQLQSAMDKMHAKGLTVEQYLSSVLSTVCIDTVLLCHCVLKKHCFVIHWLLASNEMIQMKRTVPSPLF